MDFLQALQSQCLETGLLQDKHCMLHILQECPDHHKDHKEFHSNNWVLKEVQDQGVLPLQSLQESILLLLQQMPVSQLFIV
jgi:hypothetical protein